MDRDVLPGFDGDLQLPAAIVFLHAEYRDVGYGWHGAYGWAGELVRSVLDIGCRFAYRCRGVVVSPGGKHVVKGAVAVDCGTVQPRDEGICFCAGFAISGGRRIHLLQCQLSERVADEG